MDKNMKATGRIVMEVMGDNLVITPSEGLVMTTTMDGAGLVMWVWHPMSGWLVHHDFRGGGTDESGTDSGAEIVG